MKGSWICRDYRSGDEYQILDLFKEVFGREMSLVYWKWRFIESPFGKGIIKLLFDGDKLIGHYAVIPMNVQVQDKLLKPVFSMTTMTHPDYSGQGIFAYLAEETYRFCRERGYRFVYGFPNKDSYYGFTRKLGWYDLSKITALRKNIQTKTKESLAGKAVKQIEHFDDTVNSLWGQANQNYSVFIPRTKEFLNWRFVENPDVQYIKYIISDNSYIMGYVILKVYAVRSIRKGHIVDMLSTPQEEVVKSLLKSSYDFFSGTGIRDISCWIPEDSFYSSILKEEGFNREETETYFGVRVFNEGDILSKAAEQSRNWFLTMGDSDVF